MVKSMEGERAVQGIVTMGREDRWVIFGPLPCSIGNIVATVNGIYFWSLSLIIAGQPPLEVKFPKQTINIFLPLQYF